MFSEYFSVLFSCKMRGIATRLYVAVRHPSSSTISLVLCMFWLWYNKMTTPIMPKLRLHNICPQTSGWHHGGGYINDIRYIWNGQGHSSPGHLGCPRRRAAVQVTTQSFQTSLLQSIYYVGQWNVLIQLCTLSQLLCAVGMTVRLLVSSKIMYQTVALSEALYLKDTEVCSNHSCT